MTTKAGHGHQHQHEYMSSLMVVISQSLKDLSQIVQEEANVTIVVRASCTTPSSEVNISIEYIVKQKKEEKKKQHCGNLFMSVTITIHNLNSTLD